MDFITDTIAWVVSAPFICLGWLIVGFLAGALARRIMGSPDRNFISDIVLGIIGAVVGGFLASMFLDMPTGGLPLVIANLVIAVIGACVVIAVRNAIIGRPRRA
jgi:uncharacterized membrane protein YeaQ/YmgE (transglycosylase-associated protein family)